MTDRIYSLHLHCHVIITNINISSVIIHRYHKYCVFGSSLHHGTTAFHFLLLPFIQYHFVVFVYYAQENNLDGSNGVIVANDGAGEAFPVMNVNPQGNIITPQPYDGDGIFVFFSIVCSCGSGIRCHKFHRQEHDSYRLDLERHLQHRKSSDCLRWLPRTCTPTVRNKLPHTRLGHLPG